MCCLVRALTPRGALIDEDGTMVGCLLKGENEVF
jgi:hypothetical protein